MKSVTTVSGKKIPFFKAKKFKLGFYEIDTECVKLNGKYWRVGVSVEYDHNKKRFDFKKNLFEGFIAKNQKGYFSIDSTTIELIKPWYSNTWGGRNALIVSNLKSTEIYYLNKHVAILNGLVRLPYFDVWVKPINEQGVDVLNQLYPYANSKGVYNTEELPKSNFLNLTKISNNNFEKMSNNKKIKYLTKALKFDNYNFGIEYETSNGSLSIVKELDLGLIALSDGSLKENGLAPLEYTSVVIKGSNLITAIHKHTKALNYNCEFGIKCALHLHISNFKIDYITNLYSILYNIQDELFTLFPINRTNPKKFNDDAKEYCKKLPELQDLTLLNIAKVFADNNILAMSDDEILSVIKSKSAPYIRKWNNPNRYYFVNLYNLLFKPSETVEFRIHEGTFNKHKIIYWAAFCIAILKAAENNETNLTITEILDFYIDSVIREKMRNYFEKRAMFFKKLNNIEDIKNYMQKKNDKYLL
jgi:hypothetical protein